MQTSYLYGTLFFLLLSLCFWQVYLCGYFSINKLYRKWTLETFTWLEDTREFHSYNTLILALRIVIFLLRFFQALLPSVAGEKSDATLFLYLRKSSDEIPYFPPSGNMVNFLPSSVLILMMHFGVRIFSSTASWALKGSYN